MARRVSAAGGFYSFISHGLNQTVAAGAGILIWFCYIAFSASVLGVCGYFATRRCRISSRSTSTPGSSKLVALALMTILSWFHIELTAKVLGVCLTCEVLALIVLSGAILFSSHSHFSAAPFNPAGLFNNHAAVKVFGAGGRGRRAVRRLSGRGSASRWLPTTRRSPASPRS